MYVLGYLCYIICTCILSLFVGDIKVLCALSHFLRLNIRFLYWILDWNIKIPTIIFLTDTQNDINIQDISRYFYSFSSSLPLSLLLWYLLARWRLFSIRVRSILDCRVIPQVIWLSLLNTVERRLGSRILRTMGSAYGNKAGHLAAN